MGSTESPGGPVLNAEPDLKSVAYTLELATQHSRNIAKPDGHFIGPQLSNATITAEWIFFLQSMGISISDEDREAYKHHFLSTQQSDGSWPLAPKYPHGGNLSATIEAYLALKILGVPTDNAHMMQAQSFVLRNGGVEKMRIFTRFQLAMFGLLPWAALPQMPPELIFLPAWFPINIFRFSVWARITIVPFLILRTREPVYALPNGRNPNNDYLDELWLNPGRKMVPYSKSYLSLLLTNPIALLFQIADLLIWILYLFHLLPLREKAVRGCIDFLKTRQEESGDLGGIFPPMHLSIYCLLLEGHTMRDDVVSKGLEALHRFCYQDQQRGKFMQPCVSPVWDTFLMIAGIVDAGTIELNDPLLRRAADWNRAMQITNRAGDWEVYSPKTPMAGWSFQYYNTWYPDMDDTAAGLIAFLKQNPSSISSAHVLRGAAFILSLQNKDGGWAAFDMGNDALFLNSIPFSDMDALCDPSTPDIVGHVLEAFGLMLQLRARNKRRCKVEDNDQPLFEAIAAAADRAITYLENAQEQFGGWFGRWGANYIYGTGNVLCGLEYFSEQPRVQRMVGLALWWIETIQNPDGGWGEGLDSYVDIESAGVGPSTPSQTAWALMALIAHSPPSTKAITRGVQYLVSTQCQITAAPGQPKAAGTWVEELYTGVGFPGHFYLGYDLYRHYFPMMALGRYLKAARATRRL